MKVIVAAAQFVPELVNFDRAVSKTVKIIEDAAKENVQLLVFPESWMLGYTYWASLGTRDPIFRWFLQNLMQQAGPIEDPRMAPILAAAKKHKMALSIGIHEKVGGTFYNTQILISPDGEIANAHRKLVPTNTERLVWGRGDGSDMEAIDFGFGKIGGLMCFEHQMTPARFALASLGVQIHCAQWPGHNHITPLIDASIRQLAHENGCFVVSAREVMSVDHIPPEAPGHGDDPDRWYGVGGSSIAAPNATYVVEPTHDKEMLVVSEIDLNMISIVKYHFDNDGHYTRPDVFQLLWHDQPKPSVVREPFE